MPHGLGVRRQPFQPSRQRLHPPANFLALSLPGLRRLDDLGPLGFGASELALQMTGGETAESGGGEGGEGGVAALDLDSSSMDSCSLLGSGPAEARNRPVGPLRFLRGCIPLS